MFVIYFSKNLAIYVLDAYMCLCHGTEVHHVYFFLNSQDDPEDFGEIKEDEEDSEEEGVEAAHESALVSSVSIV